MPLITGATIQATGFTGIAVGAVAMRASRNEAPFAGALMQFDRSGTVGGWIGMDGSDNLTFQRGADALNALTINRTNGVLTAATYMVASSFLAIAAAVTAAAGQIAWGGTTATTVGAAGGASALPANPVGYAIINVAGTNRKVPYYNT